MKRAKQEAAQADDLEDSDEGEQQQWPMEPGLKRINLPKKSKYRTRAHVNPMGELHIPTLAPTYDKCLQAAESRLHRLVLPLPKVLRH